MLVFHQAFASSGTFQVDGFGSPLSYSYDVATGNKNARTLSGFSTQAKAKMNDCPNCPYKDYKKFYDYYNAYDYGNRCSLLSLEARLLSRTATLISESTRSKAAPVSFHESFTIFCF